MSTVWAVLTGAGLIAQAVGMRRGWPLSRQVGDLALRHPHLGGLIAGVWFWVGFHWFVATLGAGGARTASVGTWDFVVFGAFYLLGYLGSRARARDRDGR